MSDLESTSFSEIAASNNAASPNGAPEGMAPSGVNDTIREVMAADKREWNRSHPTITSGGAANVQTLTYTTAPAAYVQGQRYSFIAGFSNGGATTLNVNGLGAKAVTKNGTTALVGGEILAGAVVTVMYDGTQFQLTDGVLSSAATPGSGQAPTSGGSANAQTVTYSPAVTAYSAGQQLTFVAGFTNTGPASININGVGAKNLFADNKALAGGEILAGAMIEIIYDGTQFQVISRLPLSAFPWAFRNVVINGGAEVWQRGAGGAASIAVAASSTAYCEDRSYLTTGANQAHTVSQQAGLVNGSRFCARVQRNNAQTGTGAMVKGFPLTTDQVAALRGAIVTFKAKVRSGANWSPASGNLTLTLYVGTAAEAKRGGGFTGETNVASATAALGTGSAVSDLTATSAAVVPANATQGELQFSWTPVGTAGANDYFEHDDVQLEIGGLATQFERRPFEVELAQCLRFYEKTFPYATAPAQAAGVAGAWVTYQTAASGGTVQKGNPPIVYKVIKRVVPTITAFNPGFANSQPEDLTNTNAWSAWTTLNVSEQLFLWNATTPGTSAAGDVMGVHLTIEAEI